jgi:hypothetical protein
MEKHLHDLEKYFRQKHGEMRERVALVESPAVSTAPPSEADSGELAPMERAM